MLCSRRFGHMEAWPVTITVHGLLVYSVSTLKQNRNTHLVKQQMFLPQKTSGQEHPLNGAADEPATCRTSSVTTHQATYMVNQSIKYTDIHTL